MSIFSKIAVTDEERAAKAKEVMKAIASFSNSQNKQEYLYSYVPRAGIAQIKEHGLLSGNEIAKPENRHLLELARPNGDADRWLKEKDERLAKDPWLEAYNGPSVLFGDLDPDKIHDKHPIKKFDAARIKIKLTDLLKDYPDTRMEGSELIPYTSEEELDALDEKGLDEFRRNRHHTLSPEEIKALIARGQNPKDMWKDFKDTEGKFYASDVPHAHLITSIGKIPSKYIEFDEAQPVIKQAGLLKAANIKTAEDKVSADWFMDTVDRDPHPDAKIVSLKPMPPGQFVFHGSNRKLSLLDIAHATTRNYGPGKEKAYEYTHPVVFASKTPSSLFTTEEVGEHKNLVDSGKRRVYHMITEGDRKLYLGTRQAGHISVLDSDGFYEAHRRLFKGGKWVDIYEVVKPSNAKVVESIPGSPFDWESIPDYEYVPAIGGRTTTLEEYLSHAKDPKVIAGIKEHLAKGPFVPQIPEALKKYLAGEAKQAAPLKTMNLFTKLAFALNAIGPEKLQDVLQPKKNPVTIKEFRLMLYPKDFEASRNFYEKHLQFPVMHSWDEGDDDKGVMFNLGGTTLELMSPEKNKHNVSSPTHLSLAVPDVHELWEQMKDGDNIIHPIRNNSWGDTSFAISDPEGHRLIFYSPNKLNKQAGKLSNLEKVVKDSIHEYKSSNPTMRILSQSPVADREFLYHASGKKFDMLDPKFNSKKVFGHEFTVPVVFAGDSPSSAFAANPTAEYQAVKDKVNDFVYHRLHDEETGRKALLGHTAGGYLYKLPASAFTKVIREDHELGKWDKSTEYLSHKPVKPISVTPIQSTDVDSIPEYEYLGQDFVGEMPAQHYLNNAKDPKVIAAVQAWLANNKKGLVKKQASLLSKQANVPADSAELTPEQSVLAKIRKHLDKAGLAYHIVVENPGKGGASMHKAIGRDEGHSRAVVHAREAQVAWEKEHGYNPDEDWGNVKSNKQAGLLKKSVHWSDDVSKNILNGRHYPISYLTGELDELKESIKNRDWNNFKEELGDSTYAAEMILAQRLGLNLPLIGASSPIEKFYARKKKWEEVFDERGVPFNNDYLSGGSNLKKPKKIQAALGLAGHAITKDEARALALKYGGEIEDDWIDNNSLSKLAAAYTASGEKVQGVGLRKMYHSLLEEQGLPGLAVNNEETGDVELSFDGDEAKRKEVFDQLSSRVKAKTGHPITFTPTANPQVSVPVNLSNIDVEKLNAIHHLAYRMSNLYNPNDSAMDSNNSFKEKIADRFRLQVNQRGLQGTVPSRASEQLSGNRPMYVFTLPDQRTRSEEEALSDMPKDQKRRLMKALLGGRGFLDPNQTKVAEDKSPELASKFIAEAELMGSRGRALAYGRPEPEDRDHDYIAFTDNAKKQEKLKMLLTALSKDHGYKLKQRDNGGLTASGNNTDLSIYPKSKRKDIYKSWALQEDGMSKDDAWAKINSKLKNKINPTLVTQINNKVAALLSPLSSLNYNPKI